MKEIDKSEIIGWVCLVGALNASDAVVTVLLDVTAISMFAFCLLKKRQEKKKRKGGML